MSLETKKNTVKLLEIGDLVKISAGLYNVRDQIRASTSQMNITAPRSQNGLYWFYQHTIVSGAQYTLRRDMFAVVVDSFFLEDGRELFVCFSSDGKFKPFHQMELSMIQARNGEPSL